MTVAALTLFCVLVTQPEPAGARAQHLLGPRATAVTSSSSGALSLALDTLPDTTALAVVLASPARMAALEAAWEELSALASLPGGPIPDLILARSFGAEPAGLLHTLRWGAIGLDAKSPLIVVPGIGAAPSLLRAGIADRKLLDQWLEALPGHERLQRRDEAPLEIIAEDTACAIVGASLFCQRGSSPGPDPLADLKRWAELPSRRLAHVRPVATVAQALGSSMDVYAILRPGLLAPALERQALERASNAATFKGPAAHREAVLEARRLAQRWGTWAGSIQATAVGARMVDGHLESRAELELDDRLAAALADTVGTEPIAPGIARWASTPALARAVLRADRAMLADALHSLGFSISPEALGGSAALLVLGLDTECEAARSAHTSLRGALPAVIPTALAFGLGPSGVGAGQESVAAYHGSKEPKAADAHVEGQTLFFASGPGGISAAVRRLNGGTARAALASGVFFDGSVDLAAVAAALDAGDIDGGTRPELRSFSETYRRLRPFLDRFRVLELSAESEARGHRVRIRATGY
ncbi:MAG: hypothetical protein U1E65_07850 [Myxococcota bacterium]